MKTEVSAQANVSAANVKQPQVAAGGNDAEIDRAVRRTVGFAALRRLRRLADADRADRQADARWVRRLSWLFGIAALLTLAWLAFR